MDLGRRCPAGLGRLQGGGDTPQAEREAPRLWHRHHDDAAGSGYPIEGGRNVPHARPPRRDPADPQERGLAPA
eukprot:8517111-Alexandrium_andersonii.AAC.1